ncbi:hypothetical protein CRM22_003173 [Opisthorchis felineus]|uniref:Uncharacterized protein n=1 Tax=Opisthorchis felineus TaxID=147828 RepID=A0A4S2M7B2_OPIFE|nr:hypothetical protein CRM22_003173 [Opisthorchis felineus]
MRHFLLQHSMHNSLLAFFVCGITFSVRAKLLLGKECSRMTDKIVNHCTVDPLTKYGCFVNDNNLRDLRRMNVVPSVNRELFTYCVKCKRCQSEYAKCLVKSLSEPHFQRCSAATFYMSEAKKLLNKKTG